MAHRQDQEKTRWTNTTFMRMVSYRLSSIVLSTPFGYASLRGSGQQGKQGPPNAAERRLSRSSRGLGAKPFILAQRLGLVTIGAAGGLFAASSPETLKQTLAQLNCNTIEFYPDAGAVQNTKCSATVSRHIQAPEKLGL